MRPSVKRTIQICGILAIAIMGALCAMQSAQNPLAEAYILGLIAVGVIGIGLSEIKEAGTGPSAIAGGSRGSLRKADPKDLQFDKALSVLVNLIQSHLVANTEYSDSLERAHRDLPALDKPEQVRAIVSLLIDENEKMQVKTNELSQSLEASRSQVAALRSNLAEANEMGMRDPLTSLGNRRFFDNHLAKELSEAHSERSEMCLVVGDLDEFKKINDRLGHPVGDMVLKLFAELLSNNIKGRDAAARFGGDEFAIIFPKTAVKDAANIVEQIRTQLEAKQWMLSATGQRIGKITASFGVARLARGDNAESLIKRADAKLYEAKMSGRNRVMVDIAA